MRKAILLTVMASLCLNSSWAYANEPNENLLESYRPVYEPEFTIQDMYKQEAEFNRELRKERHAREALITSESTWKAVGITLMTLTALGVAVQLFADRS